MIGYAMIALVITAVSAAAIDSRRRPGTPRHWRKQAPTLILAAITLALFVAAAFV